VDEEVERDTIAADPPDPPQQTDRGGAQDGGGYCDPHQDEGVVPRETEFIDLAEIDDLNVRE